MYVPLRWKLGFGQEVDRFLVAAEKHSMATNNIIEILCTCSDCMNHSHVVI